MQPRTGAEVVVLCAQIWRRSLQEWPADEAADYRRELGLVEPGLNALIRAGFRLLDLITFFTATGGKVLHAWELLPRQHRAGGGRQDPQRHAARLHPGRGRFRPATCWRRAALPSARERGQVRLEGRDYVVQDGDVVHIRFCRR